MCSSPKMPPAPTPLPQRQPARAPDAGMIASRTASREGRRFGYAATVLTARNGSAFAPPATTGKMLLGY